MERAIAHDMFIYLRCHNVISKQQHCFLSGRLITSTLLETLNDWTLTINNGKSVCISNVDFAKAFDSVCTSKLLCKLQSEGIFGQLIKWISIFLSGFQITTNARR